MISSSKYSTSNFLPPQPVNRILLAFLLSLGSAAQAGGLTDLGVLSGTTGSQGYAINATGDVVVGGTAAADSRTASGVASNSGRAFRWTATGGMTDLGTFPGGIYSIANQTNASGDVVVGQAAIGGVGSATQAFRWTQATGMVSLGGLNGGSDGQAFGVNAAGNVVVGGAQDAVAVNTRAFRWTPAGMVGLGVLSGGTFSIAYATNAAGDVVVGLSDDGTPAKLQRGFRWTQATGMVSLGLLNGGLTSFARATNAAGDVVVGAAADGAAGNADRAFRWTQATGMVSLGVLNGGTYSRGYGVDSSGNVIVGRAADGNAANASRGFRWTQATGMQSIEGWLSANGIAVNPAAAKTAVAFGTNADGSVVVGILDNNHAFLARVTSADTASGMIDLPQYNQSLDASAGASTVAVQDADMAMHGAHGSPMRGLLPAGGQSFSVAGDVGRGDASPFKSDMGTAEISYGRGLTENTMVKLSVGRTSSRQDTVFDGSVRINGTYLLPELITRVSESPLYATFSAYYNAGNATIERGYTNAGTPVISRGETSATTTALRARLDWLNAATWGDTNITPYASLTHVRSKFDAYTETGGGFPASWEARSEKTTQARLGLDAVHSINGNLSLLGRLEAVHRFDGQGSNAKGQVLGLFAFDLAGPTYRKTWARAAAGLEGKLGGGIGSLMLNATTEGQTPRYWLAANYRWTF